MFMHSPCLVCGVLMPRCKQSPPMSVLNETDIYREFRPPPALRRSIACLWVRRGDGGAVRVVPDTCTDIVWRSGHGAVVAGPDTRAWLSRTHAGETLVGARFLPGAGGPALGWPLARAARPTGRTARARARADGPPRRRARPGAGPSNRSPSWRTASPAPARPTGRCRRGSFACASRNSASSGSPTSSG